VAGVYIGITHEGVTLIGERSRQLTCLWQAIKSIELFRGPHERRIVVTRRAVRQTGSMVLTTADGKTATIAGISPEPLARALTQLGIAVQQQAEANPKCARGAQHERELHGAANGMQATARDGTGSAYRVDT
jgi:hypothetical protein